ncbi:helix-turn-helix domain-containing protein [Aquimarina sp. 2201CG5-10]|uniref:helix-turn-helix domain-containing protein n=1 Tax=Aquimarina callyspongiae TaxID=3098150 RepID=UPI002AB438C8|nr:helix-turn-helix domain-containing protein [Aquimarina sp. 2201CG5-10]MDY8136445.1 helix-turn-helix domain-containing protein [Aquimarina sp. 2201CG5-10]
MDILDVAPLLSITLGVFLLLFILFRRSGLGKDKKIKFILAAIVFVYTFISFDYYITINHKGDTSYFGISYLFIHLIGFLFYYFVILYTNATINWKKWLLIIIGYTFLRWTFFFPLFKYETLQEFMDFVEGSGYNKWLEWEYILMSLLNILLFIWAFFRLKESPLVLDLNEKQALQYKWIKLVLIAFVLLQTGILISDIIGSFKIENYEMFEDYEIYMKFETLMIAIFFFIFSFSIMHFPVFAFTGDFEDLPKVVKKKYAKSSLTDSSALFDKIKSLVKDEKLYLDFDIKLNMIAEKLGESIHHISQAINQNAEMSFPDFINSFRIEEAKQKLLESKPDTIFAISLDVGFNSKAAFYTAFKKVTSQTPTEFKKSNRT